MNFFKITVGTATRKGGFINSVERMIQTESGYSKVREHFATAYRGFDVKIDQIEAFEIIDVEHKEVEQPKELVPGEKFVETIFSVKEINIRLTDANKELLKEINDLEDLIARKERELFAILREEWKSTWWLSAHYQKDFKRKGRDIILSDAKLSWPVMISKITKDVEDNK